MNNFKMFWYDLSSNYDDVDFGWWLFYNLYFQHVLSVFYCLSWISILWNDKQWDYYFLLRIILKKLRLMDNHFKNEKKMFCEYSKNHLKIQEAIYHLNAYLNESEHDCKPVFNLFYQKYGKPKWWTDKFTKCKTREKNQYANKLYVRLVRIFGYIKEKHLRKFMDIFKNYVESWWD